MRLLAAILLVATAAEAQRAYPLALPRGCRNRSCVRGRVATSSLPAFSLAVDYEWPYTGALADICTTDSECVALCGVGVSSGSATAWECISGDGGSPGTVTDPGTATVINSFIVLSDGGYQHALDITAASQAPNLVSTAVDAIYGQVPSTTLMVGYGRATGALNHNNWFMDGYPGGVVGFMQIIYDDSAAGPDGAAGLWCSTASAGATGAGNVPRDAWSIISCRTDGVNGATANKKTDVGLNQTTSAKGLRRAMQAGTHYIFGASNARTDMVNGPLALWVAFNTNKSDTFLRNLQGKIWRDYNAAGIVTPAVSSTVRPDYLDHVPYTGNVDPMLNNAPMVEALGLRTTRTNNNTWATDALAVATWTDIGLPTVNSNTSSGPYFVATQAAECDELVSLDGGTGFGKKGLESWDAGTPSKTFTNNCYFKAGLTGTQKTSARLSWSTNGTSSVDHCDITGLTSTATRGQCTSLFNGAVTTVKPTIIIPNDAGVVGSVQVCGCFNTEGPGVSPPRPNNTVVPDLWYTMSPSTDGWPSPALGGCVEIVSTPYFDPSTPSEQPVVGDPDYLFDTKNNTDNDHAFALIPGYTGQGELLAVFRNGGTVSDILTPGVNFTANAASATKSCWSPTGAGGCNLYVYKDDCGSTATASCHATTLINSGSGVCPAAPDSAFIGNRFSLTVGTLTRVNAVRIYTLH